MRKVVLSANTSWYLYNFRKNTIVALLNSGCRVVLIAPRDDYSLKLNSIGVEFVEVFIDQGGTNPLKDIKTLFSFYSAYRRERPSVILNFTPKNNIYSTMAANILGIKVINNIAGLGMVFVDNTITSKVVKLLYKVSQFRADKVFFQNEDDRKLFLNAKLVREDITDRLPGSGVDISRFHVVAAKDDGVVRFLLIARMLFDKGIGHYVDAARELKLKYGDKVDFQLLGFLGVNNPSAVSKSQMQAWVDEGIVTYLGISEYVEKEIAKVDCQVLPSFYREGVPKTLLEAAAMGKPIVTTDNVGCRETVDDGINGFLCEPRNTDSLVEKLELIINMTHEERLSMGLNSRRKVETEFDESIVIRKYLDAIDEVLGDKK